jgi:hypothetical protein
MSVDISNLTPQQLKDYTAQKTSYFEGTIAVASIYGGIALCMFLITMFSPTGKSIIVDAMLPFTITFIGGMIIVTTLLLIAVFSVKPPPVFKLEYDNHKCPDYWELEATPEGDLARAGTDNAARMRYRCKKPRDQVSGAYSALATESSISSTDEVKKELYTKTAQIYGTSFTSPNAGSTSTGYINCNYVYPDFMNYIDVSWDKNDKISPNKLRCEYARKCNVSWTSACPSR